MHTYHPELGVEGGLLVLPMMAGGEIRSWGHPRHPRMVVDNLLLLPLHDRTYLSRAQYTAVCPAPCSSQQDPKNSEFIVIVALYYRETLFHYILQSGKTQE